MPILKDSLISCLQENVALQKQISQRPETADVWACAYIAARIVVGYGHTREEALYDAASRAGNARGGITGSNDCQLLPSSLIRN